MTWLSMRRIKPLSHAQTAPASDRPNSDAAAPCTLHKWACRNQRSTSRGHDTQRDLGIRHTSKKQHHKPRRSRRWDRRPTELMRHTAKRKTCEKLCRNEQPFRKRTIGECWAQCETPPKSESHSSSSGIVSPRNLRAIASPSGMISEYPSSERIRAVSYAR
jgi:hypothetical protein